MIVLLDLDDTLIDYDTTRIKSGAMLAIRELYDSGHILVLFSHNSRAWELALCSGLGPYLKYNCSGAYDYTKLWNLERACELTGADKKDMILFDDDFQICNAIKSYGVRTCQVGCKIGLNILNIIYEDLLPWHEIFGYSLSHIS